MHLESTQEDGTSEVGASAQPLGVDKDDPPVGLQLPEDRE